MERRKFSPEDREAAVQRLVNDAVGRVEIWYGPSGETPKNYHNTGHTLSVMTAASDLSDLAIQRGKLPNEDKELVIIAAAFHDVHHSAGSDNEKVSADLAADAMLSSGAFSRKEIKQVKKIIRATQVFVQDGAVRQSANKKNYTEQILADADLSNLGKPFEEYWNATFALYRETHPEHTPSVRGVAAFAFNFIKGHSFYTAEACELFPYHDDNIAKLKEILSSLGPDKNGYGWDDQLGWVAPKI
jgi:predicted metal-dependent HD superfamily phosphohydrolase